MRKYNRNKTIQTSLIVSSLLFGSTLFGANPPSSSDILRQVEPPKVKKEIKPLPQISKEYKAPMADDKGVKILVKDFTLTGNSVYSSEVLNSLLQEYKNKELTISGLQDVAGVITKYYRDNGYFVARAYIPAQELDKEGAVVEIAIIEGLYGDFLMKNTSLVDTSVVQGFMDELTGGDVVSTLSLERQMLLINDLGGARVTNAEIFPGKKVGQSDFTITVEEDAKYYGYAIADNYGSRYTGEYRLNVAGFINSLSGRGDVLGISALGSDTANLKNTRLSYETPLGYSGLSLDSSLSYTAYEIGKEFENLDIKGKSINFDLGVSYPFIKTRAHTLETSLKYKHTNSKDEDNYQEDRKKKVNSLTLSLNDTYKTSLLNKPGVLNSSVSLTAGNVDLNDYAKTIDTLQTDSSYSKLLASISQTQSLIPNLSLTTSLSGQIALNKNLDGTEDFSVGGAYGVRAYTDSELSGDKGYLASLELSYNLPTFQGISHTISSFIDHAKVWDNKEAVAGVEPESRTLNAVGVGYTLGYKDFSLKASYAHGFGSDKTPTGDGDDTNLNRAFVQAMVRF
jgi:hemolysin activation/secretion protein